jgi:heme exporter protein C
VRWRIAAVAHATPAVLGILAALLVPFIHLSVYLFRTLHPMPILLKPSTPSMPAEMR